MTPAANPVSMRCSLLDISPLRKNTIAAPSDVPAKGIRIPVITCGTITHLLT
jgi:hypothetical protein